MKHATHHPVTAIMQTYTIPKQISISHLVSGVFQRHFPCQPPMPWVLHGQTRSYQGPQNQDTPAASLCQLTKP